MTAPTTTPPSAKQLKLIADLVAEKNVDLFDFANGVLEENDFDTSHLTGGREGTASKLITALFKVGGAQAGTTRVDPAEGFYRVGDDVVRVVISKSGNWYAKMAVKPAEGSGRKTLDWDYLGKRIDMRNAVPMDEAEAGRFLVHCIRCGAELTNDDSKAAGMGPICRNK